jgi:hypothetical protein
MIVVACIVLGLVSSQMPPPSWITPNWVERGSHTAKVTTQDEVFYGFVGVGVATKITNKDRLKAAAEQRARSELSKLLEAYTAALANDYFQVERTQAPSLEQLAKIVADKAVISEVYVDGETHALYVRADLQLDVFVQAVAASELSANYKVFIKQNAKRVHDASIKREARPVVPSIPDNFASL